MKFRRLLFLLLLWTSCFAARSSVLYDEKGGPSQELLTLLQVYRIPHNQSWRSIVNETQKSFLRKGERWEIAPQDGMEDHYDLFAGLQMTQEVSSCQGEYQYAVILGATLERMERRLLFLKRLYNQGIRFRFLIFLTGDRKLDPVIEKEAIAKGLTTETDAAKYLLHHLDLPSGWISSAEFLETKGCGGKRANTEQTLALLHTTYPTPTSFLFVVDQPFVNRVDSYVNSIFPPAYTTCVIGQGVSHEEYLKERRANAILLDELARWLYNEKK